MHIPPPPTTSTLHTSAEYRPLISLRFDIHSKYSNCVSGDEVHPSSTHPSIHRSTLIACVKLHHAQSLHNIRSLFPRCHFLIDATKCQCLESISSPTQKDEELTVPEISSTVGIQIIFSHYSSYSHFCLNYITLRYTYNVMLPLMKFVCQIKGVWASQPRKEVDSHYHNRDLLHQTPDTVSSPIAPRPILTPSPTLTRNLVQVTARVYTKLCRRVAICDYWRKHFHPEIYIDLLHASLHASYSLHVRVMARLTRCWRGAPFSASEDSSISRSTAPCRKIKRKRVEEREKDTQRDSDRHEDRDRGKMREGWREKEREE